MISKSNVSAATAIVRMGTLDSLRRVCDTFGIKCCRRGGMMSRYKKQCAGWGDDAAAGVSLGKAILHRPCKIGVALPFYSAHQDHGCCEIVPPYSTICQSEQYTFCNLCGWKRGTLRVYQIQTLKTADISEFSEPRSQTSTVRVVKGSDSHTNVV